MDFTKSFKNLNVLIIGDLILDKYLQTDVERISGEAPVPVARVTNEKNSLGCAGNIADIFSKLQIKTSLIGNIGIDREGKTIRELLSERNINFTPVFVTDRTITKTRVVSKSNHILRIDFEDRAHYSKNKNNTDNLKKEITNFLKKNKVDYIVLADYRKGTINLEIIDFIFKFNKPVYLLTKSNFILSSKNKKKFKLIKLSKSLIKEFIFFNLNKFSDIIDISKIHLSENDLALGSKENFYNFLDRLNKLIKTNLLITDNKEIIYISDKKLFLKNFSYLNINDFSGIDDLIFTISTINNYLNIENKKSFDFLMSAIKISSQYFGIYNPTLFEIEQELQNYEMNFILSLKKINKLIKDIKSQNKKIVFTTGSFDILHSQHILLLNEIRKLGDIVIIGLYSDKFVRKLKGKGRPIQDEKSRALILSNLKMVDFVIIFDSKDYKNVLEKIQPDLYVKGGNFKYSEIPYKEIVERYGGRVKIINLEKTTSTTDIINKIINTNIYKI